MVRQIRQLCKLQICNLCGINEIRFGKDSKKKMRQIAMILVWMLLGAFMLFYIGAMDFGYIYLGMGEMIPLMSVVIVSFVLLFFSIFKAGSVIFQMQDYEMLISLPVSKSAIIFSRFFSMYFTDVILSFLVMLPGVVLYGAYQRPGIVFYLWSILGTILLPLLPITIATVIGGAIIAISGRMRHKSIVSAVLTMFVSVVIVILSTQSGRLEGKISEDTIRQLSTILTDKIQQMYPPAYWFMKGAVLGSVSDILLYVLTAVVPFVIVVFVLTKNFSQISNSLKVQESGRTADLSKIKVNSVWVALYKREWKRFLSSSVYVTNSSIGYILMDVFAIAICIFGVDKMEKMMEMPGVITKTLPYLLAAMASIMSTTAAAISMEGKQWWLTKSIPARTKDVLMSKILVNLTVAGPCYVIAEIFANLTVGTDLMGHLSIVLIPLAYILFMSVAGLFINLKFPVFDWENEITVIKQGASVMLTTLTGFVSFGIPLAFAFLLPQRLQPLLMLCTIGILFVVASVLFQSMIKQDLRRVE